MRRIVLGKLHVDHGVGQLIGCLMDKNREKLLKHLGVSSAKEHLGMSAFKGSSMIDALIKTSHAQEEARKRDDPHYSQARMFFDSLQMFIKARESRLCKEELLVVEAILHDQTRVNIEHFGFIDPSFFILNGTDPSGNYVNVVTMTTNVQIIMSTIEVKPPIKKRPIGFTINDDQHEALSDVEESANQIHAEASSDAS